VCLRFLSVIQYDFQRFYFQWLPTSNAALVLSSEVRTDGVESSSVIVIIASG
jgi:hypothetical protein